MTLSAELETIASEISLCAPDQADRLRLLAVRVRRVELALDEIVDDARESAELAERQARVVRKVVPARPATTLASVVDLERYR